MLGDLIWPGSQHATVRRLADVGPRIIFFDCVGVLMFGVPLLLFFRLNTCMGVALKKVRSRCDVRRFPGMAARLLDQRQESGWLELKASASAEWRNPGGAYHAFVLRRCLGGLVFGRLLVLAGLAYVGPAAARKPSGSSSRSRPVAPADMLGENRRGRDYAAARRGVRQVDNRGGEGKAQGPGRAGADHRFRGEFIFAKSAPDGQGTLAVRQHGSQVNKRP